MRKYYYTVEKTHRDGTHEFVSSQGEGDFSFQDLLKYIKHNRDNFSINEHIIFWKEWDDIK